MIKFFLILMVFFITFNANAMVLGGSNLGPLGYPEAKCIKPIKPYNLSDNYQLNSYKYDIEKYIDCVNEYLDNAENDISRIKEEAQEIINDSKRLY